MQILSTLKNYASQMGFIVVGIGLIVGVIALKVVSEVIANTTFSGLTATIVSYITVGLALALLIYAFMAAMRK